MWTQRYNSSAHSYNFPGGSDSGLGWTYLRYPHVASTVWSAFVLMYQFDDQAPVREMANPCARASPSVLPLRAARRPRRARALRPALARAHAVERARARTRLFSLGARLLARSQVRGGGGLLRRHLLGC